MALIRSQLTPDNPSIDCISPFRAYRHDTDNSDKLTCDSAGVNCASRTVRVQGQQSAGCHGRGHAPATREQAASLIVHMVLSSSRPLSQHPHLIQVTPMTLIKILAHFGFALDFRFNLVLNISLFRLVSSMKIM